MSYGRSGSDSDDERDIPAEYRDWLGNITPEKTILIHIVEAISDENFF